MSTASLPTTVMWWIRARGVRPCSRTALSEAMSSADDPSVIWLDSAAVSRPPSRIVGSVAIFSSVVSRIPSSRAHSPTGTTWVSKRPSAHAAAALAWLLSASSSIAPRLMSHRSAINSPPRNWWIS